jgi:hypothetical protein
MPFKNRLRAAENAFLLIGNTLKQAINLPPFWNGLLVRNAPFMRSNLCVNKYFYCCISQVVVLKYTRVSMVDSLRIVIFMLAYIVSSLKCGLSIASPSDKPTRIVLFVCSVKIPLLWMEMAQNCTNRCHIPALAFRRGDALTGSSWASSKRQGKKQRENPPG